VKLSKVRLHVTRGAERDSCTAIRRLPMSGAGLQNKSSIASVFGAEPELGVFSKLAPELVIV
jgi:hypothetical protein